MKTGDKVERIYWPSKETGQQESLVASATDTLTYHEEYHGDHSTCWIIAHVGGKEAARHNIRFLETIVWMP